MFPLRGQTAVAGFNRPAIRHLADFFAASVNHRFDRKNHSRLHFSQCTRFAVMQNLRVFVENFTDAMTAEFAHHAVACFFRVLLNDVADVA